MNSFTRSVKRNFRTIPPYPNKARILALCDTLTVGDFMAIIKNAIQCKKCGDIIESVSVHDFKTCSCGACSVDGGHNYLRRCATSLDDFIDLSEFWNGNNKKEK